MYAKKKVRSNLVCTYRVFIQKNLVVQGINVKEWKNERKAYLMNIWTIEGQFPKFFLQKDIMFDILNFLRILRLKPILFCDENLC